MNRQGKHKCVGIRGLCAAAVLFCASCQVLPVSRHTQNPDCSVVLATVEVDDYRVDVCDHHGERCYRIQKFGDGALDRVVRADVLKAEYPSICGIVFLLEHDIDARLSARANRTTRGPADR